VGAEADAAGLSAAGAGSLQPTAANKERGSEKEKMRETSFIDPTLANPPGSLNRSIIARVLQKHFAPIVLALLLVACAGGSDGTGSPQDAGTTTTDATVPPADGGGAPIDASIDAVADGPTFSVPTDMRDRIGIYAWGYDTTSWPGSPDQLNWGASKVSGLGSRTIRVYLGPEDVYHVLPASDGGTFDLATAAASPAYAALLGSASFDTILLTTYSAGDDASNWTDGYTAAEAATEQQQIASLGQYLLKTYPGKTFVLLQWEGDNAISPVASNPAAWTGFTAWIQARAAGVVQARAAAGSSTSQLYSGLEYNLVRSTTTGAPCDTSANPCVVSVVVPAVDVDYYSYSSWDSLLPGMTPAQVATSLTTDLGTALGWAQKRDPEITPARFLVGEFGAPREEVDLGECAATQRIASVIGAVTQWGAARGIFWQIIDNTPSGQPNDFVYGFGLYKANGAASLAAGLFQALYETQTPTPPVAQSCPIINDGGVVSASDYETTDIDGGTILAIFGQGFTDAGDVVHAREATQQWDIDGGTAFYTSPVQINATLPGIGGGQNALVFVTDGDGIDSNGQVVPILP
jgi:hypothetical protein